MLSQKQRLLGDAIEGTEDKLKTLKKASEQAAASVKNYDAWKKAYTPIQNEIDETRKKVTELKSKMSEMDDMGEVDTQEYKKLQEEISLSTKKIKELREAAKEVNDEFGKPISPEQYDSLQREIIETENKLKGLQAEAKESSTGLNKFADGLEKTSSTAEKASDKLSGISKGAGALIGATAALVPTTQELNRDLSFLEENAKNAGIGMEATEKAFKTFNAVSGETDSSVEAVSNLLQAGFTESNLQIAVEGVSGAMSRFPDTLKVESLADSIQETVATGKSIGQFGEYLDRAGIGAEKFDEKLEKCKTTTERTDLVLQALADGGATDAYNAWEKNNKGLKDYEDATLDMQMALGDLAKEIAPLVTEVIEFGTKGVKAFNKLPKPIKAVSGGLVGLTAVASPTLKAFSKITGILPKFTKGISNVSGASKAAAAGTKSLNAGLLVNPYAAAAAGAAALGAAVYGVVAALNSETTAAKEAAESRQANITKIEDQSRKTDIYFKQLQELESVENKTSAQKEQMKTIVDQLNESVEGLNLTYDAETDKLNMTTEAIKDKMKAQQDAAMAEAYMENAKAAMDDYVEALSDVKKAQENVSESQGEWYEKILKVLPGGMEMVEKKMGDMTEATKMYWQEYTASLNNAAMLNGQWDALVDKAATAGINIPKSLVTGIESGEYVIPETIEGLNQLIEFDKAVQTAGEDGAELVGSLQFQISQGDITVAEATKKLTDAIGGELDSGAVEAGGKGVKTAGSFKSGIQSGVDAVKEAGESVALAANSGAGSISAYNTGINFSSGLARGIAAGAADVASAAIDVANRALNAAKKASETRSPSRRWDKELGQMDGAGLAQGLLKSIPKVEAAGAKLSDAAFIGAKAQEPMANILSQSIEKEVVWDYSQIYKGMDAALSKMEFAIYLDSRQLGRGLQGMGVQFK